MKKASAYPSKAVQWKILIFVFSITLINYLDRGALAYAILPLEKAFGINNQDFGVIASAFGIGYLIMSFFGGILIDRFGIIRTWSIAALIWSLATFSMAYSTGFWSLFFLRITLGLAEAIHFPALVKTIAENLEPHWRGKCVSIGLLGVPLSSLIGAPLFSLIIQMISWQAMFMIIAVPGIIWALLWPFCFKKRYKARHSGYMPTKVGTLNSEIEMKHRTPWREFFTSRLFIGSCANFFIFGYIVFFALTWLPGYVEQTYHVNILKTGGLLIFPWGASVFFVLLGGLVSDHIWKKTESLRKARVYPIGIGMLLSGLSFLSIYYSESLALDILLLSLGLGFAFFINSPIYSLNIDLFKRHSGTAQGIMVSFFALAGIISPSLTGWLVQLTGNFRVAIFHVALLSIVAFFIALCFQRGKK